MLTRSAGQEVLDFHVLTIFFIWTLLVGYHRQYDTLVLILFMVLICKGLAYPNLWKLGNRDRSLLLGLMAFIPLILVLPARIADKVLPGYYGAVSDALVTILIVMMLATTMLLTRRFLQISKIETTHPGVESHALRIDPYRKPQPRGADHP